ncbi:S-adenosyl-L-methionine-dependent methyltransferase [Endogone sp. FLAS-F59071]|nr:S-adenosyl-L-methionine-dependent methyltransferase [Endogone sp. FLAS-F59071]|eukprot:RUS13648.1 S-adenosyl-L-methionine-dependent methyltransferase [Endogone sp. FLAS-F59071]
MTHRDRDRERSRGRDRSRGEESSQSRRFATKPRSLSSAASLPRVYSAPPSPTLRRAQPQFPPSLVLYSSISPPLPIDTLPNAVHLPRFKWVDGRGFKENGNPRYLLPNDNEEIDRMALDHYNLKYAFQTNFHAPLKTRLEQGIKVLDVGCGAAWWLKEMSTDFPNSDFKGIDLLTYPVLDLPPNVQIKVADAQQLPFPDESFDFVFQRMGNMGYSQDQWCIVMDECVRVLKPGGWIEFVEHEGHVWDAGPRTTMLFGKLAIAFGVRGVHLRYAKKLGELFHSKPLTRITHEHRSIPLGWFGRMGDLNLQVLEALLRALRPMIGAEIAHNKKESYDVLVRDSIEECKTFRSWMNVHFAYGKKPGGVEEVESENGTQIGMEPVAEMAEKNIEMAEEKNVEENNAHTTKNNSEMTKENNTVAAVANSAQAIERGNTDAVEAE